MKLFSSLNNSKAFYLLVLIPAFYSCNLFLVNKKKPAKIRITNAYETTDSLVLKDWIGSSAHTFKVHVGRQIRWVLETDKVDSITAIYEKPNSPAKFSYGPLRINGTQDWEARIDKTTEDGLEVDYGIRWRDKKGKSHNFDPKIAVKPGATFDFFTAFVTLIVLIVISIPTVRFVRRRKIGNKPAKNDPQNT
jgi:hypothetical protein